MKTDIADLIEITAGKWIIEKDPSIALTHKERPVYGHFVFIGTSGSLDYLKDSTGRQRFWPLRLRMPVPIGPLAPKDAALLNKLLALTSDESVLLVSKAGRNSINSGDDDGPQDEDP
jgi:hypothetical protein